MNAMNRIRRNLWLKLLSIVLALFLWVMVVNISRPEVSASKTVNLEVENASVFEASSKTWELDRSSVTVSYTVRSDERSSITAADFRAWVDLNDVYSETGSVPVNVEVLNNKDTLVSDVTARPSVVHVSIEDIQKKKFDLKTNQRGIPADGYNVSSIIISPETIYATGPESEIGRISSVGIDVNVDQLSDNTDGKAKPNFYDANGNRVVLENVTLSTDEISYSVTMHKRKQINLICNVSGTPDDGYKYESMSISPQSVSLYANESVIDAMSDFELPDVDITGLNDSKTFTYHLLNYLPDGVELGDQSDEINVTVRVSKIPETTEEESTAGPGNEVRESTADSSETSSEHSDSGSNRESMSASVSTRDSESSTAESSSSGEELKSGHLLTESSSAG